MSMPITATSTLGWIPAPVSTRAGFAGMTSRWMGRVGHVEAVLEVPKEPRKEMTLMTSDMDRRMEMSRALLEAVNSLIGALESGVGFDHAMYRYSQEEDNELAQAFCDGSAGGRFGRAAPDGDQEYGSADSGARGDGLCGGDGRG